MTITKVRRIQVCGQVATLKVQGPDEPGDGTVPATSAASQLGGEGVHQVFKQWGFEHQFVSRIHGRGGQHSTAWRRLRSSFRSRCVMHKVRAKRRVLLITLTVLLTFGPSINRSAAAPPHQEISVNWMESPQTFCIGRFVLQMPANFQSKWQKYTYNGSEIETTPNVSRLRFDDIVREREHELTDKMRTDNSGRTLLQTDISWLEKVVSPQSTSRLFIFRDSNNRDIKLDWGM